MALERFKSYKGSEVNEEVDYEVLGFSKEEAEKAKAYDELLFKTIPLRDKMASDGATLAKEHKWDVDKMNAIYYNYLIESNEHDLAKAFARFLSENK